MRNTLFLLSLLCLALIFAGCALDEQLASKSTAALDPSAGRAGQGDHDSYLVWRYPTNTYKDIAVSNASFYLLRNSDKDVEIRNFNDAGNYTDVLTRNYDAIDYVTSGTWKLIGADNTNDVIHVDAESINKKVIPYPAGVSAVLAIACKHADDNTIEIYLKVPNPYFASHIRKITYTKSPDNIIYDSNQYSYGAYAKGLAYNDYGDYLVRFLSYYDNIYFIKWFPPNVSDNSEDLGSFDYHVYLYMNEFDTFSPSAFDYCPGNGNYYGLDYNSDYACQAIVQINRTTINW